MRCREIEDRRPLVNEGPLENDGLENEDPRENEDFENEDCMYILQFFGSLWNSHGAATSDQDQTFESKTITKELT